MVEGTSEPGVLRHEYDGVAAFIPQLILPIKLTQHLARPHHSLPERSASERRN